MADRAGVCYNILLMNNSDQWCVLYGNDTQNQPKSTNLIYLPLTTILTIYPNSTVERKISSCYTNNNVNLLKYEIISLMTEYSLANIYSCSSVCPEVTWQETHHLILDRPAVQFGILVSCTYLIGRESSCVVDFNYSSWQTASK